VYGHAAGDMVLVQIGQRLQQVFRESDYMIRWGGEEFLLVARSVNRSEAEGLAERIRLAIAQQPFELMDNKLLEKPVLLVTPVFHSCNNIRDCSPGRKLSRWRIRHCIWRNMREEIAGLGLMALSKVKQMVCFKE